MTYNMNQNLTQSFRQLGSKLRQQVDSFHQDEQGITMVEMALILFVMGGLIYFVKSQALPLVENKVINIIRKL